MLTKEDASLLGHSTTRKNRRHRCAYRQAHLDARHNSEVSVQPDLDVDATGHQELGVTPLVNSIALDTRHNHAWRRATDDYPCRDHVKIDARATDEIRADAAGALHRPPNGTREWHIAIGAVPLKKTERSVEGSVG